MQMMARLILAVLVVWVFFAALGFWWGIAFILFWILVKIAA
jgi:hypothetical protein